MHATIKFEGYIDEILDHAVKRGLAKTKVEALRLGVLELDHKYRLLEHEDELAVRKMERLEKEAKAGKRKVLSEEEIFGKKL